MKDPIVAPKIRQIRQFRNQSPLEFTLAPLSNPAEENTPSGKHTAWVRALHLLSTPSISLTSSDFLDPVGLVRSCSSRSRSPLRVVVTIIV